MEEQTLRYYLGLFSTLLLLYFFYIINFNTLSFESENITIDKGESVFSISKKFTIKENFVNRKIYYFITLAIDSFFHKMQYGKFKLKKNINYIDTIKIFTSKSNVDYRITIIEGWEKYKLDKYLLSFYKNYKTIPYNYLIADTYIINSFGDPSAL